MKLNGSFRVRLLEKAISSGESSLDTLSWLLIATTALIVVGLAIEFWPDAQKLDRRQPSPDLFMEVGGSIVVTLAIAAELLIQFHARGVESQLRIDNHKYIAELSSQTESLRAENLKLEGEIQPRRLKPEQQKAIGETVEKFPFSKVRVGSYALDLDAAVLCGQIIAAISGKGITPVPACASESALGDFAFGVHISGDNAALVSALLKTFTPFNLAITPQSPPPATGMTLGNPNEAADARVFIGVKPIPLP